MDTDFVAPTKPLEPLEVDGTFDRVAVISDVHGNVPALSAALADIEQFDVQAIFSCGDFTWGPQPIEVLELIHDFGVRTWFVRGNAERAVIEFASGSRATERPTDDWMVAAHGSDGLAEISTFASALQVSVAGIGGIRLCHGSPRSDVELLTPGSSERRVEQAMIGLTEHTIGHGHTHLQYQRRLGKRTIFGPGSVGLPYGTDGVPGARWALVTDSIELRVAPFDIEESIEVARAVDYAGIVNWEKYLRTPVTLGALEEDAEKLGFSD